MKNPVIPDPPLVQFPAPRRIRFEWIGRFVRIAQRHMQEPHPLDPGCERILTQQAESRVRGVGEVLDVADPSYFLVRWSNGEEDQEAKKDLDIYRDEATALVFGPRLFPRDFGGGDVRFYRP